MNQPFDAYAAYYDLLYRDKDYAAEADYVLRLLSSHGVRGGSILELGCGTGRHAEHFSAAGFSMDCHDISPTMIAAASRARRSANIQFAVGDARTIRTGERHDAVLALFHVVSYQVTNEDLCSVFKTAASHLKPDGVFIFDCWYGPGVLTDPPGLRVKRVENDSFKVVRDARPVVDPRKNVVKVNYEIRVESKHDAGQRIIRESHRLRYLFEPELHLLLAACGLRLSSAFAYPTNCAPALDTWQAIFTASPE